MFYQILLIFALLMAAGPAAALDPFCDPNDPGVGTPHDPAALYVRPDRNVHFCSSLEPAVLGPVLRCVLEVDGVAYASETNLLPGTEVTLSNPLIEAGVLVAWCEYEVDVAGSPFALVGPSVATVYIPVPEPSAPVFQSSP